MGPMRRRRRGGAGAGAVRSASCAWICSATSSTCIRPSPIAVPSARHERVDRGVERLAVGRRLDEGGRVRRERHDADADALGQLGDERLGGDLGGIEPGRVDVGRLHGARHVDGEHDGRVLARRGDDHLGPSEADGQGGDGGEVDDRRQVAAPGRPLGREVGQQVEVREPDRVALASTLGPQVQAQQDRHQQQAEEHEGREEGHDGRPVVSRPRARPASQEPFGGESEVTDAEAAELAGDARHARGGRAERNASRSRRSRVSTRACRPSRGR